MTNKFLFILRYWFAWIVIFLLARLFFFIANLKETRFAGIREVLKSFLYGLRMDASMAAYITIPVVVIILFALLIRPLQKPVIIKFYTGMILILVLLTLSIDINIYKAWGSRIDATPLKYLHNPAEAWASVSNLPVFTILFTALLIYLLMLYLFNRFITRYYNRIFLKDNRLVSIIFLLLAMGLFIIPLRGGLQLAALNQSSVYFSDNNYINLASLNAPWNFLYSITHKENNTKNPFNYLNKSEAEQIRASLYQPGTQPCSVLRADVKRPNVIVLVWESFTEKVTHLQEQGVDITPGFNALKKEGIYFSNVYASGDRTDKGIVAVLSGFPAQPTTSIIKNPVKAAKLPMLSKVFAQQGYNTSFYYGGELEFANMKAYLLGGNFKQFMSKNDFDAKDQNSKWGAHDGVVMEKVIAGLSKEAQPFFCTWLTLSSHEPFETPVAKAIQGTDDVSMFLNSLHYTDQVVFDFIRQCKKQSWWNNTILLISADHGHRMPPTGKKIDDFKMPILLLGGALNNTNVIEDRIHSQADIPATLLTQLQLPAKDFVWSKNMLDATATQWAYFSFNNGYGFVQPGNYFIFDNVGKKSIEQSGNLSEEEIKKGKAIQQLSFQDYLNK